MTNVTNPCHSLEVGDGELAVMLATLLMGGDGNRAAALGR